MPSSEIKGIHSVVFSGPSGSGKSAAYLKYANDWLLVCHDEIDIYTNSNMQRLLSEIKEGKFKDFYILPLNFGIHYHLLRDFIKTLKELNTDNNLLVVSMLSKEKTLLGSD